MAGVWFAFVIDEAIFATTSHGPPDFHLVMLSITSAIAMLCGSRLADFVDWCLARYLRKKTNNASAPSRQRNRGVLMTLVFVVFICGSWLLWNCPSARQRWCERTAAAKIHELGGHASFVRTLTLYSSDYSLDYVHAVDLKQINIGNADLRLLSTFERAVEVDLDGSSISDDGLRHLNQMKSLCYVSLTNTHITDEGLLNLRPNTGLRNLYVSSPNISTEGVRKLKGSLPNCDVTVLPLEGSP